MDRAKYVRIYTDEAGESHFEDLETELIFMEFAPPEAPLATAPFLPSAKIEWLGAPLGWEGDVPHPVPTKSVFFTTQGGISSGGYLGQRAQDNGYQRYRCSDNGCGS